MSQSVRDLGSVRQGTALQASFPVRNDGGQTLRIDYVRTARGCTASAKPASLAPGAEAVVEARCETELQGGPVRRTVTLYSNDPEKPFFHLTMTATVIADAVAQPAKVYTGDVRRGQELVFEVRVRSSRPLGAPLPGGPVVAAVFEPSVPGGGEGRLRLRIRENAPLGRFSETVVLPAAGGSEPMLRVPVLGTVGEATG